MLLFLGLSACAPAAPAVSPVTPVEATAITKVSVSAPLPAEPSAEDQRVAGVVPLWLPNFYASLHELDAGRRQRHVRVLWFGDSHTAADFWTQAVRDPLQARFGTGGAGLVLLGLQMYRHGQAHVSRTGQWRIIPRSPSATWPQQDGFLGLAGMGAAPTTADASVTLELPGGLEWARGPLRWELLYRLPELTSTFAVQSGDVHRRVLAGAGQVRPSGLSSMVVETRGNVSLTVDALVDAPELFGVIVEAEAAGLVIDTLGINGARAATLLAWDADPWVEEVKARDPALVVLAYGTNEVGDSAEVSVYREQYTHLLGRLRAAAPGADCLLLGPTDRVGRDWITDPRVVLIDEAQASLAKDLGCAFFSTLGAMGGPGSLRRWAFGNPRLARRDRVHLLASGYRKLGAAIANQMLESYAARYPDAERAQ